MLRKVLNRSPYVSRKAYDDVVRQAERLELEKLHAERLLHEVAVEREALEAFRTWVPPGHFYSPYVDLADYASRIDTLLDADRSLHGIDLREDRQLALLDELAPLMAEAPFPVERGAEHRYWFDNPAYAWSDGLILHAMLRHVAPKRVVEVGSGYSSALLLDTAEHWLDPVEITFVEPYDELLRSLMRPDDEERATILDAPVQDVDPSVFRALESGDVLFIDSTHVVKPGSDVNHLVFEVLPVLAPGVVVHVHDIFHLFEYPAEWVEGRRAWQEAYLLRAFLMYNPCFEIRWFHHLMWLRHRERLVATAPSLDRYRGGGNLWLARTG